MALAPSTSYHLPRSLVILKSLSMSVLAAGLPRQSMISGLTASICPCKYGLQALISPVLGWRFFILPRSLTDKHQRRVRVAGPENRVRPRERQVALRAHGDLPGKLREPLLAVLTILYGLKETVQNSSRCRRRAGILRHVTKARVHFKRLSSEAPSTAS